MPELPEVQTVCSILERSVQGLCLDDVIFYRSDIRFPIEKTFISLIKGHKLSLVKRKAKYIVLYFSSGDVLLCHLGMTGNFRIESKNRLQINNTKQKNIKESKVLESKNIKLKHDHIEFIFSSSENILHLFYNDPRRFGFVKVITTDNGDINQLALEDFFKNIALDPLEEGCDCDYLYQKIFHKNVPIKSLLLNQSIISGIGNIYACEALYAAKISPMKLGKDISKKQVKKLLLNIQKILLQAIKSGGTTIKDYKNPDGKAGYFTQKLLVYGKEKSKCSKCRQMIKKITQSGRSTFYCSHCQQ